MNNKNLSHKNVARGINRGRIQRTGDYRYERLDNTYYNDNNAFTSNLYARDLVLYNEDEEWEDTKQDLRESMLNSTQAW